VDYDTTELVVTPRDGSRPYHGKTDGSGADYLCIASKDRPARGGAWHKRIGDMSCGPAYGMAGGAWFAG
jgi:hypothetical protein